MLLQKEFSVSPETFTPSIGNFYDIQLRELKTEYELKMGSSNDDSLETESLEDLSDKEELSKDGEPSDELRGKEEPSGDEDEISSDESYLEEDDIIVYWKTLCDDQTLGELAYQHSLVDVGFDIILRLVPAQK